MVEIKKDISEEWARYPYSDAAKIETLKQENIDILDAVRMELINAQKKK